MCINEILIIMKYNIININININNINNERK